MSSYNIILIEHDMLEVSFDDPAQNDQLVKDAKRQLEKLVADGDLPGGEIIRINGPASLPVAMVM